MKTIGEKNPKGTNKITLSKVAIDKPSSKRLKEIWASPLNIEVVLKSPPIIPVIFKIAKNVLADRLRKNNFADSLDELESIKCLEVFDDITSVEIQQILLKMSEIDREIVTLKSYGWSSREIGKIKNMPSSTVRNRLAALKKQIEKELGEPCGRRKHHNTYKT